VPRRSGDAVLAGNVNHLLYDYQLVKTGEKIEEKRILLEENGKKEHIPDASLEVQRFP
jgi:hypothetical protein